LELLSIDEARDRVLAAVRRLPSEEVPMAAALGRVLADDVLAELDLPPFRSSAMDGFARVAGSPGELAIIGESRAGAPFEGVVGRGSAVRISTGAVVPDGADAVVPIERVEVDEIAPDAERVRVPETRAGANVREAGEDVRAGALVLRAGVELGPPELAMLTALGHDGVACVRRPAVAVLATGDELRAPGEPLGLGQIRNSNGVALAAAAQVAGADVVLVDVVRDEYAATLEAIGRALEAADVVCVSGGVSVGPHDHVKPVLAELGVAQVFWGVKLKPGKPTWFGTRERRLVFGLPGNPVSSAVTFRLFAHPALRALQGADPGAARSTALLDAPIERAPDRDQAIRCRLRTAADGFHAAPTGAQGSHVLSSLLGAGALALVPAGDGEVAPGSRVDIELL
jgi:molybdopterin molybdotransferase